MLQELVLRRVHMKGGEYVCIRNVGTDVVCR